MATGRSSFAKRQRDMAKKARAQAKREKRLEKTDFDMEGGDAQVATAEVPYDDVMQRIEDLHRRYEDGLMDLDTFDEQKSSLMSLISVD